RVLELHWAGAGGSRQIGPRGVLAIGLEVLGKVGPLGTELHAALPTEAGEAVFHVVRVARLAHLAIAGDVDSAPYLLLHGINRRRADALLQVCQVDLLFALPGQHPLDQVVGARQTARVRSEDSLSTSLHGLTPVLRRSCGTRSAAPRTALGTIQARV